MNRFLLALFVATAAEAAFAAPAFQGMSYTSFNPTVLSGTLSDQSLVNMSMLGTDTVAINFWWYQDTINSNTMYEDPGRSATMASVEHAIDYAHSLGMRVFLKPMLDVQDGTWRANIDPTDKDTWFSNYTNYIGTFADMAEAKDVELFGIGCEMNRLEDPLNTQRWTDLIANVRTHYDGPLTYAANWNEGGIGGGYEILPWWDQLDYIGIDAYFPVSELTNPSLGQMQASWESRADQLEAWRVDRGLTDKQVIFTEVGLSSYDGSNITPYSSLQDSPNPGAPADEKEQADGYEALLSVMTQREWWDGGFWWNWESNPNTSFQTSFTPQWKLAQDVLANYYGGELPPFPSSHWNTGNGNIATGGNWTSGAPNSIATAIFDRGEAESYSVTFSNNRTVGQLRVGSNTVTLTSTNATIRNLTADDWHGDDVNRAIIIGDHAGDVAVVNTTSTFGTLTGRAATLGNDAGSSGTLNLTSSANLFNINGARPDSWELIVGRAGAGTLSVTGGARVTVSGPGASAVMGLEAGSSGTATVSGAGSLWSNFVALRVGIGGEATLIVASGGTVSAPTIFVGPLGEIRGNGNLTGNVISDGDVAPGTSPGQLNVSGNFTQNAAGSLLIELASMTSFDRLQVGGAVTLGGEVLVSLLDEFMPQVGDSFDILNWGSSFVDAGYSLVLPALDGARAWDASQFGATGVISVIASTVTLAGDYNGDGTVNAADYSVWRNSFGATGPGLAADGSGATPGVPDGVVDEFDYDFWKSHFGETLDNGGAASNAVPEPSSLFLAAWMLAVSLVLRVRPRRRIAFASLPAMTNRSTRRIA
jgi:T5SS/PEP-CTERM-associated repeat protein